MRATPVALLLMLSLPGLAFGQSLGDAARKEAERREKNKKAGVKAKAYSDQDLSSGGTRPAGEAAPTPAASAPDERPVSQEEVPDESEIRRQQESEWRQRVVDATAKRDEAKVVYEELNKLSLVHGEWYEDEKGRPVITSLEDLRAKIARAKARWDAAEKALENLLEEARRANVPPGWLR